MTTHDETIQTTHGPVRFTEPAGRLDGPFAAPPPPPVPYPLVAQELAYRPKWHVPEHPTEWAFPASLDNPSCPWLQTLKTLYADPLAFPASLSPDAGLLVHSLVRNIRPKRIIETGTFVGVSTIWMAAALHEAGDGGVVHSFDNFGPIEAGPWRDASLETGHAEFVAERIAQAGLADSVVLHKGTSWFEIEARRDEIASQGGDGTRHGHAQGGRGVQLAFLDADHTELGVTQDFWAVEPVLDTGGYVLLHDLYPEYCGHDGPRRLVDRIHAVSAGRYEAAEIYLSPVNYGLALLRRIS